jgi:prostaglandin E receptor 4
MMAYNTTWNMTGKRNVTNCSSTSVVGPTFSAVGLALGIFGNVLALFVIVKTSKLHKWKVFYKMITTLAVIDLTGILTTSPIVLSVYINKLQWVGGQPMCDFISFMLIFSGLTTCLIISVMAIDRYIAISHPIKYRILPKEKMVKFVIAGLLLFSAFVSFLPLFGLGHNVIHHPGTWCFPNFRDSSIGHAIFSCFYSCFILFLVLMTAMLNIIAIVILEKGRKSEVRRDSNTSNSSTRRHVDIYIMVLLIAICVVFAVCWSPFMVSFIFLIT